MQLDRRQFHAFALAMLAAGVARPVLSANASNARTLLNRLTFGATAESVAQFEVLGKEAWLERELTKPVMDDTLAARLASAKLRIEYEAGNDGPGREWAARNEDWPYQYLEADGATLLRLVDYEQATDYSERVRPAVEVQAAALTRAVHADAQLREVMTQFWHDHFNVNAMKDEHTGAYFAQYDKGLRENALGSFRALLAHVARSPSMLFYLNNEASRASPANENFGRELLELHTLGAENYFNDLYADWKAVPGAGEGLALGYIDQDVYEVARAFTGWSFGDGRWIAEGDEAPRSGAFHYIDGWHDPYQKRILAVELGPNRGPMEDGETVLDLLAHHSGTAHFIARKLIRRLLTDEPSEALVAAAAATFLAAADAPDQMAQVIRTIVLSEEFDTTPPRKLKRPFEYLASLYRATGVDLASPRLDYVWQLSQAGWNQHEFRPPSGHPDESGHWANTNTLNGTVNIALYAHEQWFSGVAANLSVLPKGVSSWGDLFGHWVRQLGGDDTAVTGELLAAAEIDPSWTIEGDENERAWAQGSAIGIAALQPHFLFR
ncbi:MAG: DUF1800 domain-containing protein [Devosia sp.]